MVYEQVHALVSHLGPSLHLPKAKAINFILLSSLNKTIPGDVTQCLCHITICNLVERSQVGKTAS